MGTVIAIVSGAALLGLVLWSMGRRRAREESLPAPGPAEARAAAEPAKPAAVDSFTEDDQALIRDGIEEIGRRAAALGLPAIVLEAYRNIRSGATSLAPGKALPAILSAAEVDNGPPTTYRFGLKDETYSIVRTGLLDAPNAAGGAAPDMLQILDASGALLFEMEILTTGYRAEEQPGEVLTVIEGAWIDAFKELNTSFSRDTKRISDDFRKKFRAKESERLKRDFGA